MTDGRPLRVGLAGLGRFGRMHAEALAALPGLELAAVCDPAAPADGIPHGAERCETFADLLATPNLQAVEIVTPDALHESMVEEALEAGLHVFVEKPLATTYAQGRRLAQLAERLGRWLQVGFILRYEARHAHLKELIRSKELGQLTLLRLKRHSPQSWYRDYGHAVHPMLEATIHDIDLCLWYVGRPCRRVYGLDRSFLGAGEAPDTSLAVLEFEEGPVAVITASWLLPPGAPHNTLGGTIDAELEVIGTRSTARIDFLRSGYSVWGPEGTRLPDTSAWPRVHGDISGALQAQLADFAACVREERSSTVASAADAVEGLAIVEAIQRSAREGRPVDLQELRP